MAEPIVGASIQKPEPATDLPGAGFVTNEAAAAASPGVQQTEVPEGFEAVGQASPMETPSSSVPEGFDAISGEDVIIEEVPEYANGSMPETAINRSPLDLSDRLRLAAGNKVGQLKFLKEKYGEANIDKSGNLQIKKDGLWYNVDPTGLGDGDAWSRTRELAGDLFDNADVAASVIGGTAGGVAGLAAGPVGAIAGSGAGAGAAEGLRTSLGRLVGTYDATPEQQLKDIGWEALLGLGGETVAMGVKPGIKMAWNALKNTEVAATNYGKEILSAAYAGLTGQPRWAFRRAMDGADNVLSKTDAALKQLGPGKSPLEAADIIQQKQNALLNSLASESDTALKGNYRRNLGALIGSTPDNFVFKAKDAVDESILELANQGFGKVVKNGEKTMFQLIDDAELASILGTTQDQLPKILGPRTKDAMAQVGKILNQYSNFPALSGKAGAQKAVEFKRAIRESLDDIASNEAAPAQIKAVVGSILNKVEKNIGQSFSDVGAVDAYLKMNKEYSTNADVVKLLKKAVDSQNPSEVDNLVKKLVSKAGSFRQLKDEAKSLGNLLGMDRVQELVDWEAAKSFVDFVPKGNAAEGVVSSAVKGAVGSTVASPRSAGATIKYGNKTLDFIRKLGPQQINKLVSDDRKLAEVLTMGGQLGAQEADEVNNLLNQAGIKQRGEQ